MRIDRHFVRVGARRVHYRRAGSGPALLLVHQSPRSSAELDPLITAWSDRFTCIAPDTPGFGQSDPLPGEPNIDDFAKAQVELLDALGLQRVGAYGFHSGGAILMRALHHAPERFSAVAIGGYAVWTEAERAVFASDTYLPPFRPQPYGEHLAWLWHRVLEQSWYFPWFAADDAHRLAAPHADPVRVDAVVRDMLDAGDAYRAGYGAVLRAPRDLPAGQALPPVLITAYDGDPLQQHIDRLPALPPGWTAGKVRTADDHRTASCEHLTRHPAPHARPPVEAADEGFVRVGAAGFEGLIYWWGDRGADELHLHPPGVSAETLDTGAFRIDLPGHGLSEPWPEAALPAREAWRAVVEAALFAMKSSAKPVGHGAVAALWSGGSVPASDWPDLESDRWGAYIHRAWGWARAAAAFDKPGDVGTTNARPIAPGALEPERLARVHRALIRARDANKLWAALEQKGEGHGNTRGHAAARAA